LFQGILLAYAIIEFVLMIRFLRAKNPEKPGFERELPFVTIQLPLYNEANVVERLIDRVAEINYPSDKLEIQILDDSTDETSAIISKMLQNQNSSHNFLHIQREDRVGFKAGALDYGMKICKGEFIAIFDADFLPDPDFLTDSLPFFNDPEVGVVQTRWTHINEKYSLLTRIQAIFLNTHFSVEQLGRNESGAYINFNGTAGTWRRSCIEDSGGWQADTLTEDLDLSFRAQMKGWKFKYIFEQESPAELPITLPAFKVQQFRWSKGAAECAKKNLSQLFKTKELSFGSKLIGGFHLLNSSAYVVILSFMLLSLPMAVFFHEFGATADPYGFLILTYLTSILLFTVFLAGNLRISKNKINTLITFPILFPLFLMTSMGISLYLMIGVIEGYLGKKSDFVRTPKFNITKGSTNSSGTQYRSLSLTPILILEIILLAYCVYSIYYTWTVNNIPLLVYEAMFTLGLLANVASSVYHQSKK
jgi:cellulose synthase/poly-beta-1,6-N-acetylglucosamine synthase-like glycosyltransferase